MSRETIPSLSPSTSVRSGVVRLGAAKGLAQTHRDYPADVLLLRTAMDLSRTVMDLSCPIAGTDPRVDFLRQLLEQEHRVTSRRFASRIRDVFRGRGLEL